MLEGKSIEEVERIVLYNLNLLNGLISRTSQYGVKHPRTKILEINRLIEKGARIIAQYETIIKSSPLHDKRKNAG